MKGVSYEQIYEAIGEFEHNFSCWRNGLGRPGIGNRIMELINKPLVDLLEEEDMYPSTFSNLQISLHVPYKRSQNIIAKPCVPKAI